MPKFYFDVYDGKQTTIDQDGIELAEVAQVSALAVEALPDIARELLPNGDHATFSVTVRDQEGASIFKASLVLSAKWLT